MSRILITGSEGLIGRALASALERTGVAVAGLDLRATRPGAVGDVRSADDVRRTLRDCSGVVHLAAVSRVLWGERDPAHCESVNVGGLRCVIDAALTGARPPWLLFASSREVYGLQSSFPVGEDAPLRPCNVYARTKVAGEQMVAGARRRGLRGCIVRLSNVYGSKDDHADRVVPAFARGSAEGQALRIEGPDHVFDFTHIEDVTDGLLRMIAMLEDGGAAPPNLHLVSGIGTSLEELAALCIRTSGSGRLSLGKAREYDVARFVGDPERARKALGWGAGTPLATGVARLIDDYRRSSASVASERDALQPPR
jgi:UDP-glucose 4-epimerase